MVCDRCGSRWSDSTEQCEGTLGGRPCHGRIHFEPDAAQIRAAINEIQDGWTPREEAKRRGASVEDRVEVSLCRVDLGPHRKWRSE